MDIIKTARKFPLGPNRSFKDNDYFIDRLSHRHTTQILIVFLILSTFKRFYQAPITCWVPAELKRYEKFMNRYCWIKGTFYVNQSYDLNALNIEARNESVLHYYQWVYIFLLFQAFLFYMPRIFWCFISKKLLSYDLFNIIDAGMQYEKYGFNLDTIIKYITSNFAHKHKYLSVKAYNRNLLNKIENSNTLHNYKMSIWTMFSSSFLTLAYVVIKIIYLLNAILQIYIMNAFLSNKAHTFYGLQMLETFLKGESDMIEGKDSKIFPKITICDVKIKGLDQDHIHSVQCVLSFNIFNERMYAFLWLWIFFIIISFTFIDLISWINRAFLFGSFYRFNFIKKRLRIFNNVKNSEKLIQLFTKYYIGIDGVFILRLLEYNSSATVVYDLINKIWLEFLVDINRN